jgi:hypothetical protein
MGEQVHALEDVLVLSQPEWPKYKFNVDPLACLPAPLNRFGFKQGNTLNK